MPSSENLRRKVAEFTLKENSEETIDIPRVMNLDSIVVELEAVVNVTAAATSVRAWAPAQLLDRVQFMADGKDVLDDVPFKIAVFGNYKRKYRKSATPPSGTAIASYTVRAVGFFDRRNINGWREKDTSFQAWLTRLLQLRITTGAASDLFVGGTVSLTSGTVKVYTVSHNEVTKPNGENDQGEPKRVVKRTTQLETFSAANTALQFQLPVGNACRLVEIVAEDDDEPSDALINNVKLSINDVDVRVNMPWDALQDMNAGDLGVHQSDVPTGVAVADSSPQGKFTELFDLRGTQDSPVTRALVEIDHNAPTGAQGRITLVVEEEIY